MSPKPYAGTCSALCKLGNRNSLNCREKVRKFHNKENNKIIGDSKE